MSEPERELESERERKERASAIAESADASARALITNLSWAMLHLKHGLSKKSKLLWYKKHEALLPWNTA